GEKLRAVAGGRARTWIVWTGPKDLQCGRKTVVDTLQGRVRARLSVDLLKLRVHSGARVGIGRASVFDPQFPLDVEIDFALDIADPHADAGRGAGRDLVHH